MSALLRKALLVATKLDLADGIEWIEKELSTGWWNDSFEATPAWRKVTGRVVARNPLRGWQPILIDNSELARIVSSRPIPQPASEIEALVEHKEGGTLLVSYHPEMENTLRACMNFRDLPIMCEVSVASVKHILDEIRNKILRWSLALEKAGVRGDGLSFSITEHQQASTVHIDIHGDAVIGNIGSPNGTANIASGAGALVQPHSITGFVSEIRKYADQIGSDPEDERAIRAILNDLDEEAQKQVPEPTKIAALIKRLSGFIGRTADTVVQLGIKAIAEAWLKNHGGL